MKPSDLSVHESIGDRCRVEVRLRHAGHKTYSTLLARNIACSVVAHAERGETVDLCTVLMIHGTCPATPAEAIAFSAELLRSAWNCSAILADRATTPEWDADEPDAVLHAVRLAGPGADDLADLDDAS